ncbi:hypothetical protein Ddye_029179 [Dipteronia dyeriana]|uniref:Uncharacterized protein n=1 Tax=Dipteronia dyeriana TaxID=168575 RepID=A0AAD9TE36_9ROSI|nr:hypothetical protein Ddye_029179 [Dipteronia dyeriana]
MTLSRCHQKDDAQRPSSTRPTNTDRKRRPAIDLHRSNERRQDSGEAEEKSIVSGWTVPAWYQSLGMDQRLEQWEMAIGEVGKSTEVFNKLTDRVEQIAIQTSELAGNSASQVHTSCRVEDSTATISTLAVRRNVFNSQLSEGEMGEAFTGVGKVDCVGGELWGGFSWCREGVDFEGRLGLLHLHS